MQIFDHKNIIKFYDNYQDDKSIYICIEQFGGISLYDKYISYGNKITENEAL
jgi:serine/threonine protein kinase